MSERVLLVGADARTHALGDKIAEQSPGAELHFAQGNAGTAELGTNVDIGPEDIDHLVEYASDNGISLTIVGPEVPLAEGIVDQFQEDGLSIFGPTKDAARLEANKAWSADFLDRHGVPQPWSIAFSNVADAVNFANTRPADSYVQKAIGLCAGKGVFLPRTKEEALQFVHDCMVMGKFGAAGDTILFQERLEGPEVSMFAFCDGNTAVPLLASQDHKQVFDGDEGLNTGGMGAYAPTPFVDDYLQTEIERTILEPVMAGMRAEGHPFKGMLFAGLMLTPDGPKVLEFNVRPGDPETQPLMMLMQSNLLNVIQACVDGTLDANQVVFHPGSAICVVLASGGYPESYEKGMPINDQILNPDFDDVKVFHAGTRVDDEGRVVTNGGRVLGITAVGADLHQARSRAYGHIRSSGEAFEGAHYRTDIGQKGIDFIES